MEIHIFLSCIYAGVMARDSICVVIDSCVMSLLFPSVSIFSLGARYSMNTREYKVQSTVHEITVCYTNVIGIQDSTFSYFSISSASVPVGWGCTFGREACVHNQHTCLHRARPN